MNANEYIKRIDEIYHTGAATEYTYRSALEEYVGTLLPGLAVINEPKGQACGKPDYIIARPDGQVVFFIETKAVGDADLDGRAANKEQFDRYKGSLGHVVFCDYVDFRFYEDGEPTDRIRLADYADGHFRALDEAAERLASALRRFADARVQPVRSAVRLAEIMAGKARLLKYAITEALGEDKADYDNQQLWDLFEAFRTVLIHDIDHARFADMYAQTIAYGLFGARLHDDTPADFTRQEAVGLIPKSNPLLRKLFDTVAGIDLDERVAWIVDDLVAVFAATDIRRVMADYGRDPRHNDPLVHFYEDFLRFYDPRQRKRMGVFYTPQPVVSYIVGAVDEVLKADFGIARGLADKSRRPYEVTVEQGRDRRRRDGVKRETRDLHRVQILDPATGTGTFLAEVVNHIHATVARKNAGLWQDYVEHDLIPRLHGFEILMASYAVAHLKLDMVLRDTGYTHDSDTRFKVYLTNSLEEGSTEAGNLFVRALSAEARQAGMVKRERPVMVMLGNPPYSGESQNKGQWVMRLMDDYKREPGGRQPLNERNPKWINDDYVKFIRLAQDYIERNEQGVIAFINPHGFLDNPTFRGMRWNLLRAFDKIYTLNLHGNTKRKETTPDGGKDENVFDIQQGVSINLFVKTGRKAKGALGRVFYADLWGRRADKFSFLNTHTLSTTAFEEVELKAPMYFFVPKNTEHEEEYREGIALNELFPVNSVGMVTTKDKYLVCDTPQEVVRRITDLIELPEGEFRRKYAIKDTADWTYTKAKDDVGAKVDATKVIRYAYRPFDNRWVYYSGKTGGLCARPRYEVQKNLLHEDNVALLTCRQSITTDWSLVGVAKHVVDDCRISNRTKERGYIFPLYIYKENLGQTERLPNFAPAMVAAIEKKLGEAVEPQALFDYVYAVLHSPAYRERYKEQLKVDFPRVPYPRSDTFRALSRLGGELRRLHLMEGAEAWDSPVGYPATEGDGMVTLVSYDEATARVYVNDHRYFSDVPAEAWHFCVGGYQPAQKWLKDRLGRALSADDVEHYELMVYALCETRRLMGEVDGLMGL